MWLEALVKSCLSQCWIYLIKRFWFDLIWPFVFWSCVLLLLWDQPFMTFTKNDKFFDHPPNPHHPQNKTIGLLFKNNRICKHLPNLKTPNPPSLIPLDVIKVWPLCIIHGRLGNAFSIKYLHSLPDILVFIFYPLI